MNGIELLGYFLLGYGSTGLVRAVTSDDEYQVYRTPDLVVILITSIVLILGG